MSLKLLITKQKITIDDHKRGCREEKNWDDKRFDVHLDKRTKTKIDGKFQHLTIKIPLNTERSISIVNAKNEDAYIPKKLRDEIFSAFSNKGTRELFIVDLVCILKDFKSQTENRTKAKEALSKIAKHFGLDWNEDKVHVYYEEAYNKYFTEIIDSKDDAYSMSIDSEKITIEDTLR